MQKNGENIEFELFDIARDGILHLEEYAVLGFATYTDFRGPPYLVQAFIEKLPPQDDKPAFVFNTYGCMSGKTLKILKRWVTARGFRVVAGHSLHTPDNYPPLIAKGRGREQAPSEREDELPH